MKEKGERHTRRGKSHEEGEGYIRAESVSHEEGIYIRRKVRRRRESDKDGERDRSRVTQSTKFVVG